MGQNCDRKTFGVGKQEKCHFMKVSNHMGFGLVTELYTSISTFRHGALHRYKKRGRTRESSWPFISAEACKWINTHTTAEAK